MKSSRKLRYVTLLAGVSAFCLGVPLLVGAQGPTSLRPAIDALHPDGRWVETAELNGWMDSDHPPVLLDARTRAEFEVSHLEGARRVDPDRPNLGSLRLPEGSRVVVYCSVGYRSADIAQRLRERGVTHVYNLLGGLFEWANEDRPLYHAGARVRLVHPYDRVWGAMLDEDRRAPLP